MNEQQQLQYLQEQIRNYKNLTDTLRKEDSHKFKEQELNYYVFSGVKLCEDLLKYFLQQKGYSIDFDGVAIQDLEGDNKLEEYNSRVFEFCVQKEGLLPEECRKLIAFINDYKNKEKDRESITYEIAVSFFDAVDSFMYWFDKQTNARLKIRKTFGVSGLVLGGLATGFLFPMVLPVAPIAAMVLGISKIFNYLDGDDSTDEDVFIKDNFSSASTRNSIYTGEKTYTNKNTETFDEEQQKQSIEEEYYYRKNMENKLDTVLLLLKEHSEETREGFDKISKKIEELSGQINAYQSLVERQIKKAGNEEEIERLISAFTDECVERIVNNIRANTDETIVAIEREKLILSLGESCWNKLDEKSRKYLISAKVVFSKLLKMDGIIDYSCVCLSITKALEVELYNRFYMNFLSYLNERFGKDYSKYPFTLLNEKKVPLSSEKFTMGTVAYVLCYYNLKQKDKQQRLNDETLLIDYVKDRLLSRYPRDEIKRILTVYAKAIETIRTKYRNRSCHRDSLKQFEAKECMNYVIDVEKLLKQMIDSFDS